MGVEILVVDDSALVRMQVKRALVAAGYSVVEAGDGVAALERLETADPTMVVCDLNMPRMNGLEFLEEVATRHPDLPVVMLTTEGQPDLIRESRRLGAKGWLVKPFQAPHLLAMIERITSAGV